MSDIGNIYEMKLHDRICDEAGSMQIVRVPGGWIYRFFECYADAGGNICYTHDSQFVPFDVSFVDHDVRINASFKL